MDGVSPVTLKVLAPDVVISWLAEKVKPVPAFIAEAEGAVELVDTAMYSVPVLPSVVHPSAADVVVTLAVVGVDRVGGDKANVLNAAPDKITLSPTPLVCT